MVRIIDTSETGRLTRVELFIVSLCAGDMVSFVSQRWRPQNGLALVIIVRHCHGKLISVSLREQFLPYADDPSVFP